MSTGRSTSRSLQRSPLVFPLNSDVTAIMSAPAFSKVGVPSASNSSSVADPFLESDGASAAGASSVAGGAFAFAGWRLLAGSGTSSLTSRS